MEANLIVETEKPKPDTITRKFSFFRKPVKNTTPYKEVTLSDVFRDIVSPKYAQQQTEQLRAITDTKATKKYKAENFDYATFSGKFKTRKDADLQTHSGYLCVDLDGLQDVNATQQRITTSDFKPAMAFVSPSGKGLKIIYRIDIGKATHLQYFRAIEAYYLQEFGIKIDEACKDVSRACFLPYDPECFYTDSPTVLDAVFLDTFEGAIVSLPVTNGGTQDVTPATNGAKRYTPIETACRMIEQAPDGQKHHELLKASRLLGGYIATGEVDELQAVTELERAIQSRNIDDFEAAQKTIRDGIAYGKQQPITFNGTPSAKAEPVPLLPIDGLPDGLQSLITECSEVYGSHRDFWAGSILAATALGIGSTHQLKAKFTNCPVLWIAIVAPSGTGKTEPLNFAFAPFHRLDTESINDFYVKLSKYEAIKAMNKTERQDAGIVDLPEYPACNQYILSDTTPEGLITAHQQNLRGVNILRDELHGWILDFGRYNKSGEVENMLSSWSEQPMTVNRKGSTPLKIERPFNNVTGGLQPEILPELAKDNRDHNGFLPRFCFVFPDNAERPDYRDTVLPQPLRERYNQYITNLLSLTGTRDEVCLSNAAKMLYADFANANTSKVNNVKTDYLKAMYAKLDVIALRLALTIHFSKWAVTGVDELAITPETMQGAISITEYFRATGEKVYAVLNCGEGNLNKKSVARYLHGLGNSQNEIAKILKVSQPYVNKILK